jgi:hypothetical protein
VAHSGLLTPVMERTAAVRDAPTGFAGWDLSLERRVEAGATDPPP